MSKIFLIRHGQSEWNAKNLFTGWVDSKLSKKGQDEAKLAGELIKKFNINVSYFYTSYLERARDTLKIILNILDKNKVFLEEAWELNERHYGSLTGLNKSDLKKKLGEKTFNNYRRSWNIAPPPIEINSDFKNKFSSLNSTIPSTKIPSTESLKDTYNRVVPFYKKKVLSNLIGENSVIIVAHGNSLRALCKYLFNLSESKINFLEIPTGNPLYIELDNKYQKAKKAYYLDKIRKKEIFFNE